MRGARNPSVITKPVATDDEALDLFNSLENIIRFLGGVYSELSGHAAAAQRVVVDLRRSLAYLHSRSLPDGLPEPWNRTTSRPPSFSGSPGTTTPQGKGGPDAGPTAVTPQPQLKLGLMHTPASVRAGRGTPPTAPTTAGGRPASTGRSPGMRPGQLTPASASMAQRQGGGLLERSSSAGSRSTSTGRAMPRTPASVARVGAATPVTPPGALRPPGPGMTTDPLRPLHLPVPSEDSLQPAGRGGVSGAGAASASKVPESPAAAVPLQLPVALRRAVHTYQEAVKQHEALLLQAPTAPGHQRQAGVHGQQWESMDALVSGAAGSFCAALESHFSRPGERAGTSASTPAVVDPKQQAQVAFAALVAAQTWLIQALTDLAEQGRTSSGVTASCVYQVLQDVRQLREDAETKLESYLAVSSAPPSAPVVPPRAPAFAPVASSSPASNPDAAIRWRNRFLRVLTVEGGGVGSVGVARKPRSIPGRPDTAAANLSSKVPISSMMPRPLGVWLPDICWTLLGSSSDVGPSQPWLPLLPAQASMVAARGPILHRAVMHIPVHAASAAQAVSYARSQSQLQLHLLQLWLESQLAPALLPRNPAPVLAQLAQRRAGQGTGKEAPEVRRLLARCRLAHVMLTKNAWSKMCCIVEQEEA